MKIIIIKLGADGDVLRTLPLAKAIKNKYHESEITWVTRGDISELLQGNTYISKIVTLPYETNEKFDILYNFDIDEEATNLAMNISAKEKKGFFSEGGYPSPFNSGAEYYINTMFDDELKKSNKKTYQEMMFDVAEIKNTKEPYEIILTDKDEKYAEKFLKENKLNDSKIIGIHLGASKRWPSKVWAKDKVKEFIIKSDKKGYKILLFGGSNEADKQKNLVEELKKIGILVYQNNPKNSKREFASLVSVCKAMVCSDSLSLHVSIALKKPTVGLFFCTSPDEVEGYGFLRKVVSNMLYEFFPEKSDIYDKVLTESIRSDEVLVVLEDLLNSR